MFFPLNNYSSITIDTVASYIAKQVVNELESTIIKAKEGLIMAGGIKGSSERFDLRDKPKQPDYKEENKLEQKKADIKTPQ